MSRGEGQDRGGSRGDPKVMTAGLTAPWLTLSSEPSRVSPSKAVSPLLASFCSPLFLACSLRPNACDDKMFNHLTLCFWLGFPLKLKLMALYNPSLFR